MPEYDLSTPAKTIADAQRPFFQHITARQGTTPIGQATWTSPGQDGQGAVQMLELFIEPPHRRKGHGRQLLRELIHQAHAAQQRLGLPLRRIWAPVRQKSEVAGRAFLTENGFHHVGTLPGLLPDQDLLIYVRSFD
jgi:ribosomal protein S18 acetylase RimI-like enzyme